MDSASFQFIAFGLACALISNLSRSPKWRSGVLFLSSLIFLLILARNPILLLPLAGFLLLGYLGIILIGRRRTNVAVFSIAAVVFAFLWLKKYSFLPHSIFLNAPYLTLGLSYIFFRVLHILIEPSDPAIRLTVGSASYLTYTLNFTTLIAGPIQRYDAFAEDQFTAAPIGLDAGVIAAQIERIIRGFFKVNVLGLLLEMIHTDALGQLTRANSLGAKWFAAFKLATVYPFFLYANFSGYIDIVIALARLMRIRLPENFDRPFSASSFLDFWNRWHITLSTWLKTYVYNPLLVSLMRKFTAPSLQSAIALLSFFVTFFLVGVWHGRTSEFVLFGVLQGGGVAINKAWQLALTARLGGKGYRKLARNPAYEAFSRGLTFSWFAFSLFWFWGNWEQIRAAYGSIGPAAWLAVWAIIWLAATLILATWEWLREKALNMKVSGVSALASPYARVIFATGIALISIFMSAVIQQPAPGIVYKAF